MARTYRFSFKNNQNLQNNQDTVISLEITFFIQIAVKFVVV